MNFRLLQGSDEFGAVKLRVKHIGQNHNKCLFSLGVCPKKKKGGHVGVAPVPRLLVRGCSDKDKVVQTKTRSSHMYVCGGTTRELLAVSLLGEAKLSLLGEVEGWERFLVAPCASA